MRTAAAVLLATLVLPMVQCSPHAIAGHSKEKEPPELRELLDRGYAAYNAGEYRRAIQTYQAGYEKATRSGSRGLAVRFLNNIGGVYYRTFRYRDAIQAYLQARDLAASQGEKETLGAIDISLSSLYFEMGEMEAALETADQGLKLPGDATARFKAKLLIQCARIKRRQKKWGQAIVLLQDAVEAARARADIASEAQAWNELGNSFLAAGQLVSAENALLEAFRLRKLTHDVGLYYAYESLGQLRMQQGDPLRASAFFDRALEAAPAVDPSALWSIYYERGKAKLARSRPEEAFADFGYALGSARRWRAEVLPADAFRIGTEVELHDVYSAYIELGSRLYAQTGRRRFAEETFTAAEENRAASLRALWMGPDLTQRLPGEYWETLAQLFQAEAALIKGGPAADVAAVRRLRLRTEEMEARAGLDFAAEPERPDAERRGLLEQTRKALAPTEVFLGFHLGATESLVWIVAQQGFELRRLPPQAQLAARVAPFVKAVREDSPEAVSLGRQLYSELFGSISRRLLDKPTWTLALDGPLFEVPFAALVEAPESRSTRPTYVVEHHAIRIVPGISALFRTTASDWNGPVVGVGDPIYNRADPRLPRPQLPARAGGEQGNPRSPVRPVELARLVGSGREIENFAGIWRSEGYQPILLTGAAANRQNLIATLRSNPSVLHIAAHMLFPAQLSGSGLIALALDSAGDAELLGASEIAGIRDKLGLVVLNGCSSAQAEALPGAGLMGMTRAWLAAGARAVIVTRWATSDQQQGELFRSFYNRLASVPRSGPPPSFARLLQQAQLAELHAAGYRANPAHWAAYFCVERY